VEIQEEIQGAQEDPVNMEAYSDLPVGHPQDSMSQEIMQAQGVTQKVKMMQLNLENK